MPGAENIQLDEHAQEELKALAASRTSAVRLWERATIIMELAAGTAKQEIAKQLGLARQTVLRWEQRFLQLGLAGLSDAPRFVADLVCPVGNRFALLHGREIVNVDSLGFSFRSPRPPPVFKEPH